MSSLERTIISAKNFWENFPLSFATHKNFHSFLTFFLCFFVREAIKINEERS
jgi:hypothetical protein